MVVGREQVACTPAAKASYENFEPLVEVVVHFLLPTGKTQALLALVDKQFLFSLDPPPLLVQTRVTANEWACSAQTWLETLHLTGGSGHS